MSRRIAFIGTYTHPTRLSVEKMLREAFPEFEIDVIEVARIIRGQRGWRMPNSLWMAREFGGNLLRGRTDWRTAYFRTSYIMRRVREAMRGLISPRDYAFSFQMQSMFDTSVPGLPHFVYTDHTHLSNLRSRHFDHRDLRAHRWIALERELYHNASRVFVRSHDVLQDLATHYDLPANRAECVYAGSNAVLPAGYAMDNDGFANKRILFVGNDWERKGGPVLVAAFRELLRTHPDARLTVVGARPVLDLPQCEVLGPLPIGELSRHYARASVFCVPSLLEPFGIVFLEAMMHRLPVVATRIGALPDMVSEGKSGRLVEPGDAVQLAAALCALLAEPDACRRLGEAGARRVDELYTWQQVGSRIRGSILLHIADAHPASGAPPAHASA